MKKNKYILITAFALTLGMTACSSFLEEDNKAGQTADLGYSTASGIKGLVGSCYSFARGWYGKEPGLGLSEMGTDLFYAGHVRRWRDIRTRKASHCDTVDYLNRLGSDERIE